MSSNQELTQLYKVGVLPEDENEDREEVAALFEYTSGGYAFLESLGTDEPDLAIEEARERVPAYILNDEITDISVTRRFAP
jgi:hypothetical protein